MADARSAWNDAGERLGELGQKLKSHYAEQHTETTGPSKEELAAAAKRVGSAVQDAFEALGTAAKDKSVQADVKQVGQSVFEALGATFGQISEEVRRAFAERKGEAVYDRVPDAAPEPPAPPAPAAPPAPPTAAAPTTTESAPKAEGTEPWGTP
jgi:hypothetical protein